MSFSYRKHRQSIRVYFSSETATGAMPSEREDPESSKKVDPHSTTPAQLATGFEGNVHSILEHSSIEKRIPKNIGFITTSVIRDETVDAPLLVEMKKDTYISIVETSRLSKGARLYSIRYGINTPDVLKPAYLGISSMILHHDDTISSYEPIAKMDTGMDIDEYRKNLSEYKQYKNILLSQLCTEISNDQIFNPEKKLEIDAPSIECGEEVFDCNVYPMGNNHADEQIFLLTLSKKGDNGVGLHVEIRKTRDNEGNPAVYVGSLVRSPEVKNLSYGLKSMLLQASSLGLHPNDLVIFERDSTHTEDSLVKSVGFWCSKYRIKPPSSFTSNI